MATGGHGHSGTLSHLCAGCPCPSGSQHSQLSLLQQREGRAAHTGLGTAMCICRVCRSSSAFSLQTSWTSGPGLVPSLAAVSPGDEGTGRTCQAPAQTGLCSSSLQPRIRRAAGHGPPDRTRAHQGDRDCLGHRAGPADPGGFQLHLHPLVPEGPRPAPA